MVLYLLGPLPSGASDARFLFTFNGTLTVGNQTPSTSIDFRVFDGLLAFRLPVSDGDIIVELGTGSSVTLRASNGTFLCDLRLLPASNGGQAHGRRLAPAGHRADARGRRLVRKNTVKVDAASLAALQRDPSAVRGGQLTHQPQTESQPATLLGRACACTLEDRAR